MKLTKQLSMNTNTELKKHVPEQGNTCFPKINSKSASVALGMALLALGLLAPRANAEITPSLDDTNFIQAAAQGGMAEVKLGELAVTNGMRDDVKEFGRMMVKDHTAINNNLKALAAQKGVTLPDSLDAEHQAMVDKMAALTGSGFDDAYIKGMVEAHQKDARSFKAEFATTHDSDIERFLDQSIPVVEMHLKHVTAMQK
jgi:putative membrane protein